MISGLQVLFIELSEIKFILVIHIKENQARKTTDKRKEII